MTLHRKRECDIIRLTTRKETSAMIGYAAMQFTNTTKWNFWNTCQKCFVVLGSAGKCSQL